MLICVYIPISLIAMFLMWFYTFGNALEMERNAFVSQVSLGNFGFTQFRCMTQYYELKDANLMSCPYGKKMSGIYFSGIVPDIMPLMTTGG
jgi:hypothetical protein